MQLKRKTWDYKWVILIVCFFMEFICLGFCSSNAGLYLIPMTEALDIPRSLYSLNSSIRYIVQVLVALSFGSLTHRFGLKRLVFVGLCALVGSISLRIVATGVIHIYLSAALLGLGVVFTGGTMAGTIVRRWFHKDIGRYTGIVMSANGIGGALAAQIISPIINNGETFGYRKAYLLSAILTAAISVVILVFLRERPTDVSESQTGGKKKPRGVIWDGIDYTVVKRKPYFYIIAVMVFLTGISLQSIGSISIAHMTDVGLSSSYVATTATVSSLVLTISKFAVGFAYDKVGLSRTILACHIVTVGAFVLKALLNSTTLGMIMAMIAVCFSSLALPLETVMIPLLSNDLFGTASYNKVLGIFMAMNSLGLCLGSPLGDLYHDIFGTYIPCFWFFAVLMVIVAIGFQIIIRIAHKEKADILSAEETPKETV